MWDDGKRYRSDIVEQLRAEAEATAGFGGGSLLERAADEIVWLRADNDRLKHVGDWLAENLAEFGDPHDDMVLKRWAELRGQQQ